MKTTNRTRVDFDKTREMVEAHVSRLAPAAKVVLDRVGSETGSDAIIVEIRLGRRFRVVRIPRFGARDYWLDRVNDALVSLALALLREAR